MKLKKMANLTLSLLMVFTMPLTAFSDSQPMQKNEDTQDKDLENAISSVKELIDIPSEYSEFIYSYNNDEANNSVYWQLNWSTKDDKKQIIIDIDNNGNILSYYNYLPNENPSKLANITSEQAEKTAENFLNKVVLKNREQFKKYENKNYSRDDSYEFTYQRYINNIPVNECNINISVDKYNGKVNNYNSSLYNTKYSDIKEITPSINKENAKKLFIDNIGIKLSYYSNYDYKEKKLNIFPAYSIADYSKALNAVTGDITNLYGHNFYTTNANAKQEMAVYDEEGNSSRGLSKEEIKEINNISGIITKEEAKNIIKKYVKQENINYKEQNSNLYKNVIGNNNYIWRISFDNCYATVDALTGELLSFSLYNYPEMLAKDSEEKSIKDKNAISYENAQKKAETFLNEIAPDKFKQVKSEENKDKNNNGQNYYFTYIRQVNGIDFVSNYLEIVVDSKTGMISEYRSEWYNNTDFPDIKNVISVSDAFDSINNMANFGLIYSLTNKDNFSLVYKFIDVYNNYLINPFTGKRITYDGKDYVENLNPSSYSDISGHWCENIVNELLENNYYLQGNKFNPDENITLINFFKYIHSKYSYNINDEEFYNRLIESKVIDKNEKPDSLITRQDAAKYITRLLNYEKIALKTDIFNNVYKDNISKDYKGYAAICYALNIITGDKENNFNGEEYITNAESAQIVYNLISNTDFR